MALRNSTTGGGTHAVCQDWNARVELGRRMADQLLSKPVTAPLEEMERALRDEVTRRAAQMADLNEFLYMPHEGVEVLAAPGLRAGAKEIADHARAMAALYHLIKSMRAALGAAA